MVLVLNMNFCHNFCHVGLFFLIFMTGSIRFANLVKAADLYLSQGVHEDISLEDDLF